MRRSKLEAGAASPGDAVGILAIAALEAPTRAARLASGGTATLAAFRRG